MKENNISKNQVYGIEKYNSIEDKKYHYEALHHGYDILKRINELGYELKIISKTSKEVKYTTNIYTETGGATFQMNSEIDFKLKPIVHNWNLTEETKLFIEYFRVLIELTDNL